MIAAPELPIGSPASQPPQPIDRIATLQHTISASRLSLWHQCRLKLFFRYILQISKAPTPALHVGTVVHAILKAWNMARWQCDP